MFYKLRWQFTKFGLLPLHCQLWLIHTTISLRVLSVLPVACSFDGTEISYDVHDNNHHASHREIVASIDVWSLSRVNLNSIGLLVTRSDGKTIRCQRSSNSAF